MDDPKETLLEYMKALLTPIGRPVLTLRLVARLDMLTPVVTGAGQYHYKVAAMEVFNGRQTFA
jgi:hypothetical protein